MLLAALLLLQTPKVAAGSPVLISHFSLDKKSINESSGLAASRRANDIYYTHNDSGDSARFWRFDSTGKVTATFTLAGAEAYDWEDMESAVIDGTPYLYLADVGDNNRNRPSIVVYRVVEPEISAKGSEIRLFDTYTFVYPDRKSDCEAVMVDPATGAIWFITKARDQKTSVYVIRRPKTGSMQTLEKVVDDLKVDTGQFLGKLVTAASASADGSRVILKTYAGGYEYRPDANRFASWVNATPIAVQFPVESQGEGVCYGRDGRSIVSSSEGSPCPISIFAAPK